MRAGLVRKAWRYRWSSAAAHCGEADKSGLLDMGEWERMSSEEDWRSRLSVAEDAELLKRMRTCTHRGRPLGSDSFVSKLEKLLGRRLRPLPEGRPWPGKNKDNR